MVAKVFTLLPSPHRVSRHSLSERRGVVYTQEPPTRVHSIVALAPQRLGIDKHNQAWKGTMRGKKGKKNGKGSG